MAVPRESEDGDQRHTSAGRAYEILKDKIITLDLAPGSAIRESALTAALSLGRTPVREALRLLQAEQLVVTVPRRGMFVSNVSITDLQQIAEIREELEGLAARLAAGRATMKEIEQMQAHCALAEHASAQLPSQAIHMDRELHAMLARASHNGYLVNEIEQFYSLSLRLWHLVSRRVQTADLDMTVHGKLAEALKDRNADLAERLIREHVRSFQRSIRAAM